MVKRWCYVVVNDTFESLSKTAKVTWFGLCAFTRWDRETGRGECWPSIMKLACFTGRGETAIKQGLKELLACGMIQRLPSRRGEVNRYVMTPDNPPNGCFKLNGPADSRHAPRRAATAGEAPWEAPDGPDPGAHDPGVGAGCPKAGRRAPTNIIKNINNNTPNEHIGGGAYETVARRLMEGILEAEYHD